MDPALVVSRLAALAQPTRLALFRRLIEAEPVGLAAGELAAGLGVAPSTLSFHLKELAHAGLVSSRQAGRFVIYRAAVGAVEEIVAYLTDQCCAGHPELCARRRAPAKKATAPRRFG